MHRVGHIIASIAIIGSLLAPLSASASLIDTSFGGRVVGINFCVNGAINVIIKPAGLFQVSYIWVPWTITFLAGPPTHLGQQLLGTADIPYFCYGYGTNPPLFFGQRMQIVGTNMFI